MKSRGPRSQDPGVCETPSTQPFQESNDHEELLGDVCLNSNVHFRQYLSFDWVNFPTASHLALSTHALCALSIWKRCVSNEGHLALGAWYLFGCISAGIRVIFFKLHTSHFPCMQHIRCKCDLDRSVMEALCLESKGTFRLHLRFSWSDFRKNVMPCTLHAFACTMSFCL